MIKVLLSFLILFFACFIKKFQLSDSNENDGGSSGTRFIKSVGIELKNTILWLYCRYWCDSNCWKKGGGVNDVESKKKPQLQSSWTSEPGSALMPRRSMRIVGRYIRERPK